MRDPAQYPLAKSPSRFQLELPVHRGVLYRTGRQDGTPFGIREVLAGPHLRTLWCLYFSIASSHSRRSRRTNLPILTYRRIHRRIRFVTVRISHYKWPAISVLVRQSLPVCPLLSIGSIMSLCLTPFLEDASYARLHRSAFLPNSRDDSGLVWGARQGQACLLPATPLAIQSFLSLNVPHWPYNYKPYASVNARPSPPEARRCFPVAFP
jgi:hypothetical protein